MDQMSQVIHQYLIEQNEVMSNEEVMSAYDMQHIISSLFTPFAQWLQKRSLMARQINLNLNRGKWTKSNPLQLIAISPRYHLAKNFAEIEFTFAHKDQRRSSLRFGRRHGQLEVQPIRGNRDTLSQYFITHYGDYIEQSLNIIDQAVDYFQMDIFSPCNIATKQMVFDEHFKVTFNLYQPTQTKIEFLEEAPLSFSEKQKLKKTLEENKEDLLKRIAIPQNQLSSHLQCLLHSYDRYPEKSNEVYFKKRPTFVA